MLGRVALAFVLVIGLAATAVAQAPQVPTTPAGQAVEASKDVARVYVYRYKQYAGSALEPSIYCDEVQLARMDNGRYFVVELPAGKHAFRANDKQSVIELDLKAGQASYIRMELAMGFWKGSGRLMLMMPEQGAAEIKKLEYLGGDKIKDTKVLKTAPTP